jgi:signal transduction histidine kinase
MVKPLSRSRLVVSRFFRSLYWKLSATFLLLLVVLAVAYVYITAFTAEMYFQEANQRINAAVAEHIAREMNLIVDGMIDQETVATLFHNIMVINPSVEVYLLDPQGKILSSFAPGKVVQRISVSLEPIHKFLQAKGTSFVLGDDPKNAKGEKVFSAARIERNGKLEGYLYVILGGEEYDSAAQFLLGSYILRLASRTMGLTLIAAAVIGLVAFRLITKSLRTTIQTVREFQSGNFEARVPPSSSLETQQLARAFNEMAETIVRHIEEMKTMDNLRRDLVANVSHDLRTPLVSIHGYVETILMKEDTLSKDERLHYLTTVRQSAEKLKRLVEELFELSKLEAKQTKPRLEPFSIAELVQDVAQKFQLLAEQHQVRIETLYPRDLPLVTADIALIERVFQNLLENALKHTPANGVITIRLEPMNNQVKVNVADTGLGIPPEELPFVFQRYRRSSQGSSGNDTGAGLGLAIVKKILEVHGLSISVSSRMKEGTAFSFHLPVESPYSSFSSPTSRTDV